jgi:hypothetical protein
MMHRRSSKVIRALLLATATALLPLCCAAQAAPAGTQAPIPSRLDIFGGYTYYHPINTFGAFGNSLNGYTYEPIVQGGIASVAAYFSPHFGVEIEGAASPYGPDDCSYIAQGGLIFRDQIGRLVPFLHILAGGARAGGPQVQPCTWGYGTTVGIGFDYIPSAGFLRNRFAFRPIQADLEFADIDFGANTAPTFFNGGIAKISAYRLSAGGVIRFGGSTEVLPAEYGCTVQPVTVFPGDPITVSGSVLNLESGKRMKPVYTWTTSGGKIEATDDVATISTADLAAGDYVVSGRVSEGSKPTQHAECAASFRIQAYDPPTITCSANPSSILPGGVSTITAEGRSPQNRPLNYSYATTAGQLGDNKTSASLSAADVSPGTITVTCNVVDDLGKTATSTTTVTVVAPPPPPAPAARSLCSIAFDRDRKRPVRVDNEAKGCLDDIALELNRESGATLVVVGKHDPQESPESAAERSLNVKLYLTAEKGIDANRIELRTGESTGRTVDNILVPPGATWDTGGTTSFDATKITSHGEPYAPTPR